MNEHEKLETALDILERFAHRNGASRLPGGKVQFRMFDECNAAELLAKCGRLRITDRGQYGEIEGYWRDEDPERKAGK